MSTGQKMCINTKLSTQKPNGEWQLFRDNEYCSIVRCAYDPNDKQVNPLNDTDKNLTLIDGELNYLIRFQNTGNDFAKNIKLIDTLSEYLDINTFKLQSASHNVDVQIDGQIITFLFNRIYLPDSTTNENESHGFVHFVIKPLTSVPESTLLFNTASIYFDSNPPIHTNLTKNTLVSSLASSTEESTVKPQVKIVPNPANSLIQINVYNSTLINCEIYDSFARLVSKVSGSKIDVSQLKNGTYIIVTKLMSTSGITSLAHKLVVLH